MSPKREGRTLSSDNKEQKKKKAPASAPAPAPAPVKEPPQSTKPAAGPRRVSTKQAPSKPKAQPKAEPAPARQMPAEQPQNDDFHLDQVLEQASSKHWATREECFKRITGEKVRGAKPQLQTLTPPFTRLASLAHFTENVNTLTSFLPPAASTRFSATLASHITDPHHRVATAALELTLACMIDSAVAQILASHLPLLLPPILSQLVSTKTTQRALSNDCLNACRRAYDPSALASVLCAKFSEANDRVKPGMLELLAVIVPEAGDYLGVVINMRSFLQRMGVASSVRPPPSQHLMGAIEGALAAMYHLSETGKK